MNKTDPLSLVFTRNAFYRRMHFLALAALALNFVVIIILLMLIVFLIRNPTPPLYFATDPISRLIDIIPTNQPNMSDEEVIRWTREAVEAAYSYDYVNYAAQLQAAQKYFTNYGWREFMRGLTASDNLLAVTERKLIGRARVVQKPKLIAQGLLGGALAWKFEMPVLMTFQAPPYNDRSSYSIPWTVTVLVQRQPILQSYQGLGIVQAIAGATQAPPTGPREISPSPTG